MLDTPSSSLMIAFLVVTAALAAADSRTAQTDALPEEDVLLLQMGVELHGNTQAPSAIAAQPAVAPAGDQRPPLDEKLHPPGSAPSIPANAATKLPFAGSPPSIALLAEQGGVKEAEAENLALLQVTSTGIGFFTLFLIILVVLVFLAIVWGLCRPPNPTTQGSPASEKQRTRRGVDFDRGLRPPSALNSAVSARTSLKETEPPAGTLAVAERHTARGVLDRGASDPSAASLLSSLTTAFRSGGRDAPAATGSAPSTSTGRRPQEQAEQPERIERLPPPLAPALVVQSNTVRFYVEAPVLSRMVSMGSGSVDVFVPSGKKLFNITLDVSAQNSKTLALFTTGAEDDPRGVVVNSFDYSNRLQILGRKGVLYGEIEITSTGGRVLREGSPVMAVQIGTKSTLEATAQSVSGRQQYAGGAIDQNRWNFQAVPGFDAVLGLVTILSLLTEM